MLLGIKSNSRIASVGPKNLCIFNFMRIEIYGIDKLFIPQKFLVIVYKLNIRIMQQQTV